MRKINEWRAGEMHFTHLRLSNWRNFTKVDVPLSMRMFLVGPNASGKSNFLEVFRFLRDIAQAGGGFEKAVDERRGISKLRCLAARQPSDIEVEVEVGKLSGEESKTLWRYRLRFNQDKQRRPILKKEEIWKGEERLRDRPDSDDNKDPARLTQTHLEQVNMNQEFRDLVHFFANVQYLHLVPHMIREPERLRPRSGDPFGGDFLEQIATMHERTRKAILRKISKALRIAVPQLKELDLKRDDRGVPHLEARYEHWRPQGAWHDEKLLSDGTLRFLGFLWSLLEGEGPLLLEEPELSLHPAIVRRLARVIYSLQKQKGRQVLVSTHSYDLITDKGIGAEEVIVLEPSTTGTKVTLGKNDLQIMALLERGASIAEAVMPRTDPDNVQQLELFGRE
jgi:predicted ATPase